MGVNTFIFLCLAFATMFMSAYADKECIYEGQRFRADRQGQLPLETHRNCNTETECKDKCDAKSTCVIWQWQPTRKICWIMDVVPYPDRNSDFGINHCDHGKPTETAPLCQVTTGDRDNVWKDYRDMTKEECIKQCDEESDCLIWQHIRSKNLCRIHKLKIDLSKKSQVGIHYCSSEETPTTTEEIIAAPPCSLQRLVTNDDDDNEGTNANCQLSNAAAAVVPVAPNAPSGAIIPVAPLTPPVAPNASNKPSIANPSANPVAPNALPGGPVASNAAAAVVPVAPNALPGGPVAPVAPGSHAVNTGNNVENSVVVNNVENAAGGGENAAAAGGGENAAAAGGVENPVVANNVENPVVANNVENPVAAGGGENAPNIPNKPPSAEICKQTKMYQNHIITKKSQLNPGNIKTDANSPESITIIQIIREGIYWKKDMDPVKCTGYGKAKIYTCEWDYEKDQSKAYNCEVHKNLQHEEKDYWECSFQSTSKDTSGLASIQCKVDGEEEEILEEVEKPPTICQPHVTFWKKHLCTNCLMDIQRIETKANERQKLEKSPQEKSTVISVMPNHYIKWKYQKGNIGDEFCEGIGKAILYSCPWNNDKKKYANCEKHQTDDYELLKIWSDINKNGHLDKIWLVFGKHLVKIYP